MLGNGSEDMIDFANFYQYTDADYEYENQAVTFIDNHDVSRFLRVNGDQRSLDVALALTLVSRGIPNIYYGTTQYVDGHDASSNGGRVFMEAATTFDKTTRAYKVVQKLSALRQQNDAVAWGLTEILYSTGDVLVMSRRFYDKEVVIAVNRSPYNAHTVPALSTNLPTGTYDDELDGELDGASASVVNGGGGPEISSFQLSQQEVAVWSHDPALGSTPRIGDMQSVVGRAGNEVTIFGTGLDGSIRKTRRSSSSTS